MAKNEQTKKLYLSKNDRIIAGVAGGLGNYFNLDPTIIRIVFIILAFANGVGALLYLILMIVIPEEPGKRDAIDRKETITRFIEDIGSKIRGGMKKSEGSGTVGDSERVRDAVAVIIIAVGLLVLVDQLFDLRWLSFGILWPMALVFVGLLILIRK